MKNCLKSTSVIVVSTTNGFCYAKETITCYHQFFADSKDEWNTKEVLEECMKNEFSRAPKEYNVWDTTKHILK